MYGFCSSWGCQSKDSNLCTNCTCLFNCTCTVRPIFISWSPSTESSFAVDGFDDCFGGALKEKTSGSHISGATKPGPENNWSYSACLGIAL